MKRLLQLHAFYAFGFGLLLSVTLPAMAAQPPQPLDQPAPECSLTTLDGAPTVSLQALKGKVVYVDFWASWCPPCRQAFPFLSEMQQRYGEQGLRVVGVNLDENLVDAEQFLSDYPAGFTVVADRSKQCAQDFAVMVMPSSYLIDRDGVVRYIHRGFRPGETEGLRLIVEQLLGDQP